MALLGPRVRVLLLAGGQGERLWPKSTRSLPKQFLRVDGDKSLLRGTFLRASTLVDYTSICVITGREYEHITRRELPELPEDNLILEPVGRNTGPALGLGALWLERTGEDLILVALPSDHHITDEPEFRAALAAAVEAALGGDLVTVGVRPTRPETGYGYIRLGDRLGVHAKMAAFKVAGFVEKPGISKALRYHLSGDYLWNSGILVCQVTALWRELSRHLPQVYEGLQKIGAAASTRVHLGKEVEAIFEAMPRISMDYGILERSDRVVVVPSSFGWSDVGDWASIGRLQTQDEQGNTVRGRALLHEARGMVVEADSGRLVVVVGARDLIVVDTPSALLVCDKERAQEVRQIAGPASSLVESLVRARSPDGKVVEKPWGREVWWAVTDRYAAKLIEVRAGHSLSLQYHERKHETLYIQSGEGRLRLGEDWHDVRSGNVFGIEPGTVHRLEAVSDLTLIEVSTPDLDDVVRLEDRYGRIGDS